MLDGRVIEEPLHFGEGGRLFGVLTLPEHSPSGDAGLPTFVFLSAGLLHRVGPFRLHVRLARELALMGFRSLRVDLAGKGDSAAREGLTNQQSVAADFNEITAALRARLDSPELILAGLCSGADNAVRLTLADEHVIGMILLDPICFPDPGFKARARRAKFTHPIRISSWIKNRLPRASAASSSPEPEEKASPLSLRDLPTLDQMRRSFEAIRDRGGRVVSIYTSHATFYYNQQGQLARVLDVDGYDGFATELFWPEVGHTYHVESTRRRLMDELERWGSAFQPAQRAVSPRAESSP